MLKPPTNEAYRLLHDGSITFSRMEHNGMRVDMGYLKEAIASTKEKYEELELQLRNDDVFRIWRRRFGDKASLGSNDQLAEVVYGAMDYPCQIYTDTGKQSSSEEALAEVDLPFTRNWIRWKKLKTKVHDTYLMGIYNEVEYQGSLALLHPSFNIHLVKTYRSSSDSPNFHNFPIRDPEMGEIIRKCFIPRPGHVLIDADYKAVEVKVAYCYHWDPMMLAYLIDPTTDMHRDMAAECYMLRQDQVSKLVRYCGKNMYVFPQFYGSDYLNCCANLWRAITKMNLRVGKDNDGISLKEHLASKGITELGACDQKRKRKPVPGTFEHHIQQVDKKFWGKRFMVYKAWKDTWYAEYQRNGGFHTLTGFTERGIMSRNDVINHPVQGDAFHCTLWSAIEIDREIRRNKMRAKLIGQIHDSINGDVPKDEEKDYIAMSKEIMSNRIRDVWRWIIVPLEVEIEVAEDNWFEKKAVA